MTRRAALVILCVTVLPACARLPRIDMAGMPLPSAEIFRFGVQEEPARTEPYKLSPENLSDVKRDFSAAFTDGRTLVFGPIGARRQRDASLAVCGLVSVRDPDDAQTGMKLFDGTARFDEFGTLRFSPNRLAGANGRFIDIYGSCRDLGLM